jgi:outer membrane protein assembly factor BamA
VGVTDPLFLGSDVMLDTGVEYNRREEPSFEFEEGAIETSLRKRWTKRLATALAYRFERSNLISEDLTITDPEDVPSDFDVSAFKLSAVNDTRDNILLPRTGTRTEVSGEWADAAIGSELDFLRGVFSFAIFKEIRKGTVLAGRTAGAAIIPTHDTIDFPLQERFFLGGENSVRSYEESQLGPKDAAGEPVGGEAYTLFSLEVRQALWRNFGLVVFGDAGSLVPDYSEVFSDPDYGYALGLGLRYEIPVGSIRLDFGWNPDPEEDEEDYAIHFSIGQAF